MPALALHVLCCVCLCRVVVPVVYNLSCVLSNALSVSYTRMHMYIHISIRISITPQHTIPHEQDAAAQPSPSRMLHAHAPADLMLFTTVEYISASSTCFGAWLLAQTTFLATRHFR